jgi:threonine/homoserine efflux transporter RhtA
MELEGQEEKCIEPSIQSLAGVLALGARLLQGQLKALGAVCRDVIGSL